MTAPTQSTLHPRGPALLAGLTLGVACYLAGWLGLVPVLIYEPVAARFTFHPEPGAIGMGYYGILLLGAAGFSVGHLAVRLFTRGRGTAITPSRLLARAALLLTAGALIAIAVVELRHAARAPARVPAQPRSGLTPPAPAAALAGTPR